MVEQTWKDHSHLVGNRKIRRHGFSDNHRSANLSRSIMIFTQIIHSTYKFGSWMHMLPILKKKHFKLTKYSACTPLVICVKRIENISCEKPKLSAKFYLFYRPHDKLIFRETTLYAHSTSRFTHNFFGWIFLYFKCI
jgi:hypothetical protein